MKRFFHRIADYIRECDKALYILCIITTLFGCVMVLSATYVHTAEVLVSLSRS